MPYYPKLFHIALLHSLHRTHPPWTNIYYIQYVSSISRAYMQSSTIRKTCFLKRWRKRLLAFTLTWISFFWTSPKNPLYLMDQKHKGTGDNMSDLSSFFMWHHMKYGFPLSSKTEIWMTCKLHVSKWWAGSPRRATSRRIRRWRGVTFGPHKKMTWTLFFCGIAIAIVVLVDVMWDGRMSWRTTCSSWILNFVKL